MHIHIKRSYFASLFKIANDGCFSEAKASSIIRSLLEAVEYLHSKDLVHRDIKPENIIFAHAGEDSDIKLIDFGLSRSHPEDSKPMSNPVGTSYYMAPEVLKRNYTRSCDVWSIGVVAYILLCGYPPFNGGDDARIREAILAGKLRFTGKGWSSKSAGEWIVLLELILQMNPYMNIYVDTKYSLLTCTLSF